jgi:hypothetical protein
MQSRRDKMMVKGDEFEGRPELVRKRFRALLAQNMVIAILVIYAFTSLSISTYNVFQSTAARDELIDCTTEGGECWQRSQENIARYIQQLSDDQGMVQQSTREIVVLAAACSNDERNRTVDDIKECVQKEMGEQDDEE